MKEYPRNLAEFESWFVSEENFIKIPTKQEMLKTVEMEVSELPSLFYGNKKELEDKNIKPVTIWG